uniref:Auxilin-like protein n=1 Tax=Tanacetum cinerariifolium TaxID=118510 RepID=A0A6L2MED6_TANCI|nr:auxilin-like protein [Tanacetum cinerariifolium]
MIKDMKVYFDMTVRQKAVFECLRAPHAQDFLLAIPIDGLGQHMSPMEYRTILKYRLMIPLFIVDAICLVCRKTCFDSFGEHVVPCKELTCFKTYGINLILRRFKKDVWYQNSGSLETCT